MFTTVAAIAMPVKHLWHRDSLLYYWIRILFWSVLIAFELQRCATAGRSCCFDHQKTIDEQKIISNAKANSKVQKCLSTWLIGAVNNTVTKIVVYVFLWQTSYTGDLSPWFSWRPPCWRTQLFGLDLFWTTSYLPRCSLGFDYCALATKKERDEENNAVNNRLRHVWIRYKLN